MTPTLEQEADDERSETVIIVLPIEKETKKDAVTSLNFSITPSSDLFVMKSHRKNLHLHGGLRSHSFTVYVKKLVLNT